MATKRTSCSPKQIERYLSQQLDSAEEAALELHLDTCVDCRTVMENVAAEGDFWTSATKSLATGSSADEENDQFSLGSVAFNDSGLSTFVGAFLTPSEDPAMLGRIANYEVCGIVGHGAMGVVLKAFEVSLNRFVAIKVMSPSLSANAPARKRFAREAQAAAAVVHNNVTAIHAISEWNGLPYLVMPYVGGESLQRRIDCSGPLSVVEILRVGHQVASGLAAAHRQGLIHRDIKPSNILLESGIERLQITDFGLARAADDATLTQSGVIAGTPQYMSPEQARGEAIDHRSDLFSLGSVLYAVATGHAPFRAETPFGVLRRISDEQPRSIRESCPDVPAWLCNLIAWLHQKRPDDRLESASEAANVFEQCLAHVQQPDVIDLPPSVTAGNPKVLPVALLAAALLLGGGLLTVLKPNIDASANPAAAASDVPDATPQPVKPPVAERSSENKVVPQDGAHAQSVVNEVDPVDVSDEQGVDVAEVVDGAFKYQFTEGVEVPYSVSITADGREFERKISGRIVYRAEVVEEDRLQLHCRSDLSRFETSRNSMTVPSWPTSYNWAGCTGQHQLELSIDRHGSVLQREKRHDLAFALGDMTEFLLPELAMDSRQKWSVQKIVRMQSEVRQERFGRSGFGSPIPGFPGSSTVQQASAMVNVTYEVVSSPADGIQVKETISTIPGQPLNIQGAGTVVFDSQTSQVLRYSSRRIVVEADSPGAARTTVEVQCLRVTPEEQAVWEEQKSQERAKQKHETERPFTSDEVATLVADLAADKDTLSWLLKIDRKPAENISAEIVDSLIPLLKSDSRSCKRIAKQIIDRIPDERLNPFETVSPSSDKTSE